MLHPSIFKSSPSHKKKKEEEVISINWKLHGLTRYFPTPLLQSSLQSTPFVPTPRFSRRGNSNVFPFLCRNQNSPRISANLNPVGISETCRIRYSKNRVFLPTDHANLSPRIFFSPPLLLLCRSQLVCAILRFLCRSLSLSLSLLSPPLFWVSNSACLLVHFMNFLLTNDTRKPNTRSYLSTILLRIVCKNIKNLLACLDTPLE